MINTVSIIGSGQVGTSLALALVKSNAPVQIRMTDIDPSTAVLVWQRFKDLGLSTKNITFCDDIESAVQDSDLTIIATPVDQMGYVAEEVGKHGKEDSIVIDTGSTKQLAIPAITNGLNGRLRYVPCHNGNGGQGSGPMTGDPGNILGANSWLFVVHDENHPEDAPEARIVKNFFTEAGVQVATTDALTHDRFFGRLSHLQHVIKFCEMAEAENDFDLRVAYTSAGGAFHNSTRIALAKGDSPENSPLVKMWVPIFDQNREAINEGMGNFLHYVEKIKVALLSNDRDSLIDVLREGQQFRASIKDPRERESIEREQSTISGGLAVYRELGMMDEFKRVSQVKTVSTLLRPYIFAVAQTLNARDLDADLVRDKANPSFRDGTFAALFNPETMADMLLANGDDVLRSLEKFDYHRQMLTGANDNHDKEAVAKVIYTAQQQRNPLGQPQWNVAPEHKLAIA